MNYERTDLSILPEYENVDKCTQLELAKRFQLSQTQATNSQKSNSEANNERKDMSSKEKIDVQEHANANKCTQLELAKRLQLSQAQVSKLVKNNSGPNLEMNFKRKDLSLKEKIEVLEYANANKCTQLELAKKFQISQAQVSKMLKNKEKILDSMKCNANPNLKRKRTGKEAEIEDALLHWFSEKRALSIPVSGLSLMQKAEEIAQKLNIKNFKATNGWLYRWKKRNQLSFKRIRGGKTQDDALQVMNTAWNNISLHAIQDYFLKYKFPAEMENDETIILPPDNRVSPEVNDQETFPKCDNFDDNLETCVDTSNCEPPERELKEEEEEDFDPLEMCSTNKTPPSPAEVINACYTLRCFLENQPNVDFNLFCELENQITILLNSEMKQLKTSDSKESACAYKYGEMKIKELRRKAEAALGEDFDIKEFHDVILRNNGPLELVEKQVDHYIASMNNTVPGS